MGKGRFEAFSDGVLAIIITIMVLELRVPHGENLDALRPLLPVFLSYVLSFVNIGIYWNNHHHMLHTVKHVTGGMLWANLHLLFWLSLLPFTTAWLGENHLAAAPMSLYGLVLLMSGAAYKILQEVIISSQGKESLLKKATGSDVKGMIPFGLYATGVVISWWIPTVALALYILVALLWLMPGAVQAVLALSERYEIFVASAAMEHPVSFSAKFAWLREYLPMIPPSRCIFCGDKSVIGADYLIDDSPYQLIRFRGVPILFLAAHNANETRFRRVNDWPDAVAQLLGGSERSPGDD